MTLQQRHIKHIKDWQALGLATIVGCPICRLADVKLSDFRDHNPLNL
jgi:hypothetical protein